MVACQGGEEGDPDPRHVPHGVGDLVRVGGGGGHASTRCAGAETGQGNGAANLSTGATSVCAPHPPEVTGSGAYVPTGGTSITTTSNGGRACRGDPEAAHQVRGVGGRALVLGVYLVWDEGSRYKIRAGQGRIRVFRERCQ